MYITISESTVVSLELILLFVELFVLIVILSHMRKMREHAAIEREEIKEIRRLHEELGETISLLREDIKELHENQLEMHKTIKMISEKKPRF